jgi:phi13 family phage major tail protein
MGKDNPAIGVDRCYIAKLLSDPVSGAPSWDTPVALPGIVKLTVNANGALVTDWADNKAFFVTNSRGNTQVQLENVNIDPAILADMLGQTRANGITIENALDQSAYYALGFRVWIGGTDDSGGKIYRYVWLYKGKFAIPSTNAETKKATITPQHVALSAEFVALSSVTYDGNVMAHGRSDCDLPAAVAASWFNAPVISTSVDTGAVSVVTTFAAGNVIFTFAKIGGGSFTMAEATAIKGKSVLVQIAGAERAGAFAWSGQGTVAPVLTFTPTVAIAGGTSVYASVTSDLKDTNGVSVTPNTTELTA